MKNIIKNQDKTIEYYMSYSQDLESQILELKSINDSLEKDTQVMTNLRSLDIDIIEKLELDNYNLNEEKKELEEKLEMTLNLNNNLLYKINFLTKDDNLNIRILKSELDIDYEQLEIMFRFLPLNRYFESHFQLVFDYFPTDVQKEKHKDLRDKLYKILVNNSL